MKRTTRFFLCICIMLVTLSYPVLACKCINQDADELHELSDIVVLATPDANFNNEQQKMNVNVLLKGTLPEDGLLLSQKINSCGYPLIPMPHQQEYLLFVTKTEQKYILSTRCYSQTHHKGMFDLRMKDSYANVARTMLGAFFKAKGKIPRLEMYVSFRTTANGIENTLSIKNLEDREIEILHPSSRNAYNFIVLDEHHNTVQPQGYAKVDPHGGTLTLPPHGVFNHKIEPASRLYFPYLSGTAQFGYALEKGKQYYMHVLYRPYGGTYGTVTSNEKAISP